MSDASSSNHPYTHIDRSAEILHAIDSQSVYNNTNQLSNLILNTNKHIYDSTSLLTGNIANVGSQLCNMNSDIKSTIETHNLGLRNAVDQNSMLGVNTTERTASQLASAIERNGSMNTSVSDRNTYNLGSAIERNSALNESTIYRTNALALASIEKNYGDTRLTNVVTDAASRQVANDLARDITQQINSNSTSTNTQMLHQFGDIKASVIQTGYETRGLIHTGFSNVQNDVHILAMEQLKQQNSQFSSLLLEGQKSKEQLNTHMANAKYESLKNNMYLANNLSSANADAKYEALVNQNVLSSQMMKNCCDIKSTVDQRALDTKDLIGSLDTNRLRDDLIVSREETNLFKVADLIGGSGYGDGYGYGCGRGRGRYW